MKKKVTLNDVKHALDYGTRQEQTDAIEAYIASWTNSKGYHAAGIVNIHNVKSVK